MRSNLSQEQKLAKALEGLEELKQKIIELRFGLCSSKPLTTREVAKILSREASPQTILQFASHHKHDDGSVSFSEKDVALLEAEALRELARPGQSQPLSEPHVTGEAAFVEATSKHLSGKSPRQRSSSKSVEIKRSQSRKRTEADVENQGIAMISKEGSISEDVSVAKESSGSKIHNENIGRGKSAKSGMTTRKLSKVA